MPVIGVSATCVYILVFSSVLHYSNPVSLGFSVQQHAFVTDHQVDVVRIMAVTLPKMAITFILSDRVRLNSEMARSNCTVDVALKE